MAGKSLIDRIGVFPLVLGLISIGVGLHYVWNYMSSRDASWKSPAQVESQFQHFRCADLDGDGTLDLRINMDENFYGLRYEKFDEEGNKIGQEYTEPRDSDIARRDLDGDGKPDVIGIRFKGKWYVIKRDGQGKPGVYRLKKQPHVD